MLEPIVTTAPALQLEDRRLLSRLRLYAFPIVVLCLALPITSFAVWRSLYWLEQPFPGFLLMPNAMVTTVGTSEWPADKNAVFHSQVVAVDGKSVHSSREVYDYVSQHPIPSPIVYRLRKDGEVFEHTIESRIFDAGDYLATYGVLLFGGVSWLVFGIVVGFLQPRTVAARVYTLQGLLAGLYPITGVFLHQPGFPKLTTLYFALECIFPATWIHLAAVFPIERRRVGWRRLFVGGPYAASVVLTFFVLRDVHAASPDLLPLHLAYLYAPLSFAVFLIHLAVTYRRNRNAQIRGRIRAVVPGTLAAGTLAAFALINSASSGRSFPVQFGLLLAPAFSASVAYAIAKHDLFDIDRFVRQTFVYSVLSLIIVTSYALVLTAMSRVMAGFSDRQPFVVATLLAFGLALTLEPLRRAVQGVVDRSFYRNRLDYRLTIGELSAVMTTLLRREEIVAQIVRVLTESMQVDSARLCLIDDGTGNEWWLGPAGQTCTAAADGVVVLASLAERFPEEFSASALAHRSEEGQRKRVETFLEERRTAIVLPLMFRGRAIGLLLVGAKRSGSNFDLDDISILRTLANQTAIALQNARSYAEVEELAHTLDARVRQQTEELRSSHQDLSHAYDELKGAQAQLLQSEKMASLGQLVAGVAHELNNPASFIHGGLSNLSEYLGRLATAIAAYEELLAIDPQRQRLAAQVRVDSQLDYVLKETPALLRICTEGSQRIRKIVDDLRIFARAENGERSLIDIGESIDDALRLLDARVSLLGVTLRRDYKFTRRVPANAAQLGQIWTNLLSNALDALEGRRQPVIEVSVRECSDPPSPGDFVEVRIYDNGAGIDASNVSKLFEPFFTTKPIGRGTGLGLSIAYGAVKGHGGIIKVDSAVGIGTTLTVLLPAGQVSR
ncbi:MAG TPA: ATP-binding protein [Candidatus Acidoferrales bacterium]|nr:ATP-binding protein [Candidatus Acidoferrales bacterium]